MVNELDNISTLNPRQWELKRDEDFHGNSQYSNWGCDDFDILVEHVDGYRPRIELVKMLETSSMYFLFVNHSSHGLSKVLEEHGLPRLPREFHITVVQANTAYRHPQPYRYPQRRHTWQEFGTSI